MLPQKVKEKILNAIVLLGGGGGTIADISEKTDIGRHTLSKYLTLMEINGIVNHKPIGKAKVWFISKAPVETVLNSKTHGYTFSEKILSNLVASIPMGILVMDKNYSITYLNSELKKLYGEIYGTKFYEAILGKSDPMGIEPITDLLFNGTKNVELTIIDKEKRTLKIKASRFLNPDESTSVILTIEDFTEHRKLIQEITKSESYFKEVIDIVPAAIFEIDVDGNYLFANGEVCANLGKTVNQIVGKKLKDLLPKDVAKKHLDDIQKCIKNGKKLSLRTLSIVQGKNLWFDVKLIPMNKLGAKPSVLGITIQRTGKGEKKEVRKVG